MLSVKNLKKSFGKTKVIHDISLDVKQGEIIGLLGPNGAGKTTTFYMIAGLIKPDFGNIRLDHKEIRDIPMYKRAQEGIGYLPQETSLFKKLSVEENLFILWEYFPHIPKNSYETLAKKLLDEMKLSKHRYKKCIELSGGEKRRVEIMRLLSLNPKYILLDEPFAGIDPIAIEDIKKIIISLTKKNIGVIITDHNVRETLDITQKAHIVHEGKILIEGSPDKIKSDPLAIKYYLGKNFNR